METFKEIVEQVFVFVAAFILSVGTCQHRAVTCESGPKVEVGSP